MRTSLVAVIAVVTLLAGCTPSEPQPSASPSPTVVTTPTPTPTASRSPTPTPSPTPTVVPSYPADLPTEDPEVAAIIEGWKAYQTLYEQFASDPFGIDDWGLVQRVTVGDETQELIAALDEMREMRIRTTGGQSVREVSVVQGAVDTAEVSYCLDLTRLVVLEIDSEVELPRQGTFRESAQMERGRDGVWRVAGITNRPEEC